MIRWIIKLLLFGLFLWAVSGCAAPHRIPLHLAYPMERPRVIASTLQGPALVRPLEDARETKDPIGRRIRIGGQVDTLSLDRPAGRVVAEMVVEALRRNGMNAELVSGPEGGMSPPPRWIIEGVVRELRAEAKGGIFHVRYRVRTVLELTVQDRRQGDRITVKLESRSEPVAVRFTPEGFERVVVEILADAVDRFVMEPRFRQS
jgi:hypothetical protein